MKRRLSILAAALLLGAAPAPVSEDAAVPRYAHIFVIVEENKEYAQILDNPQAAPVITGLAKSYGNATRFYAERHPSEPNYVALVGGDTFGIADDDAFFCVANATQAVCRGAGAPGYAAHTVVAPHIGAQLETAGLTWKGYYEDLPEPGSEAIVAGTPALGRYASKHSGFLNFASVQNDPKRAEHLVGFDRLDADLAAGDAPSFALIVPNECNDMHGDSGAGAPPDCTGNDAAGLIHRGDALVGTLVRKIQASSVWSSAENAAIVITFDEGSGRSHEGCCGADSSNGLGGSHIPTIVVTNHGRHGVADPTPYNHYSLLRTIEDAFGIHRYLGHAADTANGVVPMEPLFRTGR